MKLWDRREPLKSAVAWIGLILIAAEVFLVIGGRWVLVGQNSWQLDNSVYERFYRKDATAHWTVLHCSYFTGRSFQEVNLGTEYAPAPRECPFIVKAT